MRFMMIVKASENRGTPPQEMMDAIAKMGEEAMKSGKMIVSGGLAPTAASTRMRVSQGALSVTDGPFTETKEVVGGFAIMEFASKAEAVESGRQFMEIHRKYWPGWEGETEIRQVFGADDYTPEGGFRLKRDSLAK